MNYLIKTVRELKKGKLRKIVEERLDSFKKLGKKGSNEWFCELCFCILTANSKARTALSIQEELGSKGFLYKTRESLCKCIKRNKHRFHNIKAKYIIEARKYKRIKDILKKEKEPREWLVKNIKGLGYKESSHFLRNVGFTDYAILDRHILNVMEENKIINEKPKNLNRKNYLKIEQKFNSLAKKLKMSPAELDLYMWYTKTGEILK